MNKLILGDSLTYIKTIEDNSIDHVIVDLPYFQVLKEKWDNQWKDEQDYLKWVEQHIIEYKRILRPHSNIFLFTSRQLNRKVANIMDNYFIEQRVIIWHRKRFNSSRGNSLASSYEPILFYSNSDKNIFNNIKIKSDSKRKEYVTGHLKNGISLTDCWTDISALPHNSTEKTDHKSQKPLKLMERIIQIGTNENDMILDHCCGSGTTGVAAYMFNRKYILIDSDKLSFDIANNRLSKIIGNEYEFK